MTRTIIVSILLARGAWEAYCHTLQGAVVRVNVWCWLQGVMVQAGIPSHPWIGKTLEVLL